MLPLVSLGGSSEGPTFQYFSVVISSSVAPALSSALVQLRLVLLLNFFHFSLLLAIPLAQTPSRALTLFRIPASGAGPRPTLVPTPRSCWSPQAGRRSSGLRRRRLRRAAGRENSGESGEGAWDCNCGDGPVPAVEVRDGDSRGQVRHTRKRRFSNGWQQVLQPAGRGPARTAASRLRPLAAATLAELESARALA